MKKLMIILQLLPLFALLQSCQEYDMVQYGEGEEINFMGDYYRGTNKKGPHWVDEVKYLDYEKNFGINKQGDSLWVDTLLIGVKIMGVAADHPRKIVFKVNPPKENALEVILPEECYMPADTGMASFKILVKRPATHNATYTTDLTFDYDHSDFRAGTAERQIFKLKAMDKVTMELWGTTEEEWMDYYGMFFGDYSDTKARFIITKFGCLSLSEWTMTNQFMEVVYGNLLYSLLEEYKADPSNSPLIDENTGEWIEFPDLSEML